MLENVETNDNSNAGGFSFIGVEVRSKHLSFNYVVTQEGCNDYGPFHIRKGVINKQVHERGECTILYLCSIVKTLIR